jgi:LysM repeat protein
LATVIILAVIGIGLYMVINSSEPIPPDEAAGVLLEIPQLEGDLANLIDEGIPSSDETAPTVPPFSAGDALADPPNWAPPATDDTGIAAPDQPGASATGQLPQGPAAGQVPALNDPTLPAVGAGLSLDGGKNAFSAQIERQAEGGVTPQEVTNPYASTPPIGGQTWGDIPPAVAAENVSGPAPIAASEPPATAASPYAVARQAIEQTLTQGNLSQALLMLSQYCGDPQLTPTEREELDTLLGQLAGTVIYSTQHNLEPAYRVQPGETLADVAARFQVTPQLLAKINGLSDTAAVPPGTELKVVRGPFHAIYDQQGLRLVVDGRYAGRFAAGGSDAWSAETWTVEHKVPGPQTAAVPPGGNSKQILLSPSDPAAGTSPAAILTGAPAPGENRPAVYVSAKDMEDLYDILTVGSRVTIRR